MRRSNFAGNGLTRGTQFRFWTHSDQKEEYAFGFLEDTPSTFQLLIGELTKLGRGLPIVPAAEAYLRSVPIAPNRFSQLQQQSGIHIQQLEKLTSGEQEVVRRATQHGFFFEPISRMMAAELLRQSGSREFWLTDLSGGYQITLYDAAEPTK